MSIMPAGGWNAPEAPHSQYLEYPPEDRSGRVILAGLACCAVSLIFLPPIFGLAAFVIAVVVLVRGRIVAGLLLITASVLCSLFGFIWGAFTMTHHHPLNAIQRLLIGSGTHTASEPQSRRSEVYSVQSIDERKNEIPTGTELTVKGTLYTAVWDPTDYCEILLGRGHLDVQHGEPDPAYYCRYSIALTDKNQDGQDMWPGTGLMCDVTPEELQRVTRLHHYGERVKVHGTYAPSLDFDVANPPGFHFGLPVLDNCNVE